MRTLAYVAAAVAVAATGLVGCDDSCVDLSQQICRCESTQTGQQACLQRLDGRTADRTPTADELEQCNALLDTCSCSALADGDYAACGLSEE